MDFTAHFSEYWAMIAILVAGISAIVGIVWDVKDKKTAKITVWGKTLFSITVLSTTGALIAQILANKASNARNQKAQDQSIQLLTQTRQSLVELSRILQPLDQPEVTLYVDLNCGPPGYEAFCLSAQTQANEEYKRNKAYGPIPPGYQVAFDWSKWPPTYALPFVGPVIFLRLYIFKTRDKFEEYARGCLSCVPAGDLYLEKLVTSEEFSPIFLVKTDDTIEVKFDIKPKSGVRVRSTHVMAVPDFKGAVVFIVPPFPKVLTPRMISLETPRGQRMEATFHSRDANGEKIFIAEFPGN